MKIKSFIVALAALAVSTIASAQEDPAVLWNKAVQAVKAKNYTEALTAFEQTVEAAFAAENFELAEKAQGYIPNCHFQIGYAQTKAKDFDNALVNLAKAEETAKLYNDSKTLNKVKTIVSQIYTVKGAAAFNSKDYASAVEVFVKGYEANPQDTKLALYLAMSYCELGDWENGVRVYTDVIALEKRHSRFAEAAARAKAELSQYLLVKAQEENNAGNKEAAYATLETLINADPINYDNQLYRLQTAATNEDWDNVVAWGELAAAIATLPAQQSEIYYLIAVAHDTKNNNEAAIESYKLVTEGDKLEASQKRIVELNDFIKAQKEHK
ncbi:MAG: hypothetical protein J6R93_04500 [Tidjanibacter sp.]|nr:hypothetical protein [Tidjanibacter sp.]